MNHRIWKVAAVLVAFLIGGALGAEEHELLNFQVQPTDRAYEGPESLAEQVRYSETFEADGGLRVEVQAQRADVHLALVDGQDRVREAETWVRDRTVVGFGRVPESEYRLRVVARSSHGPARFRVLSGGFSPTLLAIALFLLLAPPLGWTLRRNLR